MAVSIKDIARLAGVSHSTVSRALRDSVLIPPGTRERIQAIAKQQGYSASAIARSLVTRRTHMIGVVVTSIADPFNGEVVSGIEEVAHNAGYTLTLATSEADPTRELSIVRAFGESRVDGVLVASSRVGSLYGDLLAELGIPIVLLNNQHGGEFLHSVSIDNVDGAMQATRYLISLGHQRIAYLGDQLGMESDAERFAGFTQALTDAGLSLRHEYVAKGDGKPGQSESAAQHLLRLAEPPTAIFCYNDMSALGVLEAAAKSHMQVPQDISVCGFDDLFFAPYLKPALTTLHQPKRRLGANGMQLLLSVLGGEKRKQMLKLRGQLKIRDSASAPHGFTTSRSELEKTHLPDRDSTASPAPGLVFRAPSNTDRKD